MMLQWSPPFLWPGYHIDYFNVSTINKTDDNIITFDIINATFNELVNTYYHVRNVSGREWQLSECEQLTFEISSYNIYHGSHPQTYTESLEDIQWV